MSLPTLYQDYYYVYFHVDPNLNEIMYIGYGKYDRAWTFRPTTRSQNGHYAHLVNLAKQGYTPADWVKIQDKGLSAILARSIEKEQIAIHKPRYNAHKGLGSIRKLKNPELVKKAKELKSQNLSYSKIAKELGLSHGASAWRYVNE